MGSPHGEAAALDDGGAGPLARGLRARRPALKVDLFVPGRLCLFGEHSDWAGGYRRSDPSIEPGECLIAGTDQGLRGSASSAGGVFVLHQQDPWGRRTSNSWPADPGILGRVAGTGSFDSYAAGTAAVLLERFPGLGLELDVRERTLPLRKGLSSSAAICVLTARAFDRVHGLGLSIREEMELAYRGELLTGSSCGRMDQACACGRIPVLLSFDGDRMDLEEVRPGAVLHYLVADLGREKDTRRILADLNSAFAAGDPGLRRALGPENRRILRAAAEGLRAGDAPALGALMTEAQEIFDRLVAPCCPSELAAPALHSALTHPAALELAYGGKGVGSQGDGAVQFLCRGGDERRELAGALSGIGGVRCLDLTVGRVGGGGA